MSMTLDDYFNQSRERYRADRQRWEQQAAAEQTTLEAVQSRELAAIAAAKALADAQRDALAAAALSTVPIQAPPEGSHPAMASVYREINRRNQAAALAQAEADARDPARLRQLATDRQQAWENAYRAKNGTWPTIEEMDQAGVLAPWLKEKWAAEDAARIAADRQKR
jgi:hypothetical protein